MVLHDRINKQIASLHCTASFHCSGFNMSLSIIPAEMSTKQHCTAAANIWHIGFKQMGHHSELQHVY